MVVRALEVAGKDQRAASDLFQSVVEFRRAVGGVDVYEDQAGARGRIHGQDPFCAVRGPDADPIAWLQSVRQQAKRYTFHCRV